MLVSGKTEIIGIFGYPVRHSLSPAMHNAAFASLGLDIVYAAFEVEPGRLREAVEAVRALNMPGVNITVPHKEKVIPLLDRVDEEATFIGAVNTVVNKDGKLTGYNTDGRGFMSSLEEAGISTVGKSIMIIGAGGASRAISFYLSEKAASVSIYDIDRPKLGSLVNDLGQIRNNVILLESTAESSGHDIIINATPLGLKPDDPLPLTPDGISPDITVCDLIYKKTALLQEAEKRGARTLDGAGMLLWQGVLAFELWTEQRPPVHIMREVLVSGIRS